MHLVLIDLVVYAAVAFAPFEAVHYHLHILQQPWSGAFFSNALAQ